MSEYNYTLIGCAEGFELKSNDIDVIHQVLNCLVCKNCKTKKSEAIMEVVRAWPETRDNYDPAFTKMGTDGVEYVDMDEVVRMETEYAFPDNYDELGHEDQVKCLMNTPCGASYTLLKGDETLDTIYTKSSISC